MAILNLIDKKSFQIDNKKCSIGIFIDLSKAFHTNDHNILIDNILVSYLIEMQAQRDSK